jgi:hypothetical protein
MSRSHDDRTASDVLHNIHLNLAMSSPNVKPDFLDNEWKKEVVSLRRNLGGMHTQIGHNVLYSDGNFDLCWIY